MNSILRLRAVLSLIKVSESCLVFPISCFWNTWIFSSTPAEFSCSIRSAREPLTPQVWKIWSWVSQEQPGQGLSISVHQDRLKIHWNSHFCSHFHLRGMLHPTVGKRKAAPSPKTPWWSCLSKREGKPQSLGPVLLQSCVIIQGPSSVLPSLVKLLWSFQGRGPVIYTLGWTQAPGPQFSLNDLNGQSRH